MPCPHFSISIVKRSAGQSAVASAAYQSGAALFSEHDNEPKAYSEKSGIVHAEIMLCTNAPPEYSDRNTLWNAVEKAEIQWNSQLARKIVLALPNEVPKDQYPHMLRDYCAEHFVSRGMCVDFAIHDKGDGNPHAHIMLTMRSIGEDGRFMPKATKEYVLDENGERIKLPSGEWKTHKVNTNDWNEQSNAEVWRSGWAKLQNEYLERAHSQERVDLRSFERQGIDQVPTVHMGPAAQHMEKRGIKTELGNLNRDIKAFNKLMHRIMSMIRGLSSWINAMVAQRDQLDTPPTVFDMLRQYINVRYNERMNWSSTAKLNGTVNDSQDIQVAVWFMQEHKLETMEDIQGMLDQCRTRVDEIGAAVKANNSRIDLLNRIMASVDRMHELQPVYSKYKGIYFKTRKDKYYADHKQEIDEYNKIRKFLLKNGATIVDGKLNISVSSMRSEIYALEHDSRERQKDLGTLNYDLDRLKKIQYYINYADEHSDALRALPKFKKTALQKEVDEILQQKKQPQQQTTTQAKRSKPSL